VFRARGLSPSAAEQRAAALLGEDDAGTAAMEVEAGEDVVGSAGAAAGSSFVAFATGAVIPLLPLFVSSGRGAIVTSAVLVGLSLFATGTTVGVLTGGPLVRRGLLQLTIGAAAAVVTYALGRVFGATSADQPLAGGVISLSGPSRPSGGTLSQRDQTRSLWSKVRPARTTPGRVLWVADS
jgi:VIT1/CCC1 family predicted Fe2+/Mn2+ transporter